MKTVEFFCGTKSFSRIAEKRGHQIHTIDIDPKFSPHLVIDILNFEISMLPKEFQYPDMVWFSPPCEKFSHANRSRFKNTDLMNQYKIDLQHSISMVKKSLFLIENFSKNNSNLLWVLENPQTGTLKKQPMMNGLPYTDASYCQYGKPYRKQTRFWNNFNLKLKTCDRNTCEMIKDGKHIASVGNGRKKYTNKNYKREEKYSIPELLVQSILEQLELFFTSKVQYI